MIEALPSGAQLNSKGCRYRVIESKATTTSLLKPRMGRVFLPDLDYCRCCVRCTSLNVKISEIPFKSAHNQAVGCMLGTADLLGQMADRTYLERLPRLGPARSMPWAEWGLSDLLFGIVGQT